MKRRFHNLACVAIAGVFWACQGSGTGATDDAHRGGERDVLSELSTRCEAGDGGACWQLVQRYREGGDDSGKTAAAQGVVKNTSRALDFATRGCSAGHPGSCRYAGHAYQYGRGAAEQDEQAIAYYERGCELGERASCGAAGQVLLDLSREADARRLFERGCEVTDDSVACLMLGVRFAAEPTRKLALFERACELGEADDAWVGCLEAGKLLAKRPGRQLDALRLWDVGCERVPRAQRKHAMPCHLAERLRLENASPPSDYRLPAYLDTPGPEMIGPLAPFRPGMPVTQACDRVRVGCTLPLQMAPLRGQPHQQMWKARLKQLAAEVTFIETGGVVQEIGVAVADGLGLVESLERRWGPPAEEGDLGAVWISGDAGLRVRVDPVEWGPPKSTIVWFSQSR